MEKRLKCKPLERKVGSGMMEHYGAKEGSPAWRVAHQEHMETAMELKAAELENKQLREIIRTVQASCDAALDESRRLYRERRKWAWALQADLKARNEELEAELRTARDAAVYIERLRAELKRQMKQCPRCKGEVKHMGKDFEELTCESCLAARKALEEE